MVGKILGCVCCILCAVPFFIISAYGKNSKEPIPFWSGDATLKKKVKNFSGYNKKMAALYQKYAAAFLAAGIGCLVAPALGIILAGADATIGIYLLWREYKKILRLYS